MAQTRDANSSACLLSPFCFGFLILFLTSETVAPDEGETYGQNWTPEIATKFKDFMKEQTNKTINQSGNMKFNDGTK